MRPGRHPCIILSAFIKGRIVNDHARAGADLSGNGFGKHQAQDGRACGDGRDRHARRDRRACGNIGTEHAAARRGNHRPLPRDAGTGALLRTRGGNLRVGRARGGNGLIQTRLGIDAVGVEVADAREIGIGARGFGLGGGGLRAIGACLIAEPRVDDHADALPLLHRIAGADGKRSQDTGDAGEDFGLVACGDLRANRLHVRDLLGGESHHVACGQRCRCLILLRLATARR